MLTIRYQNDRGQTNTEWLNSMHSFSFGDYYDPNHVRYGALRVINEDYIIPGAGFATHPHENMEIITYVVKGELAHKDSMGYHSIIKPGDVQIMSAGTGVTHSEFNASETEEVHLLQIWIIPKIYNTNPEYQQKSFAPEEIDNTFRVVISPNGEKDSLVIKQDSRMLIGQFAEGYKTIFNINPQRKFWLQLVKGAVLINDEEMLAGDGLAISHEKQLDIVSKVNSEILLFDLF